MNHAAAAPSEESAATRAQPLANVLRQLYLTLFLRGRSARGVRKATAPKTVGKKLAGALALYALFGGMAAFFASQPIFLLSAYLHATTFIFLGMFVAASAGEVLFNRDEADILLHRPIPPQTLLWAKIRVLAEVSFWLAAAFNLVGLFVGLASPDGDWRFPLVHLLSTGLMALFSTGCVVMIYQLCLRWFGREWLDNVMTTAQVILTIGAVAIGQVLPQLMRHVDDLGVNITDSWWPVLFPPAWFAGLDDLLAGTPGLRSGACALLAIVSTGVVLGLTFGKLAGDYQAGLQTLSESRTARPRGSADRRWLARLVDAPPLRWLLRDSVVRASFLLTTAYLARDRDVKLRIYPGLAPFLIFPLVMIAQGLHRGGKEGEGFMLAFACGYVAIVPLMALDILKFSQNWQAADLFHIVPLAGPAKICHGARWAVICILTLPLLAFLALGMWLIRGPGPHWFLLLPSLLTLPVFAILPHAVGGAVPLSQPTEEAKASGRGMVMMGIMFASIAISGLASLAQSVGWLWHFLAVEVVVVAVLYTILRQVLDHSQWKSLE